MSISEHIKEISEASKNGNLTIFVGAGVSKLSKYPDWKELTDEFAKKIGIEPKHSYSNEEYLSIPQKYYYLIGKNDKEYYKLIKEQLDKDIEPNIVHNLILRLKPVNIITTNFDDLIEKSVSKNGLFYDVISNDIDVAKAKASKYILKVHGDLKRENIVLKEEDYLNYAENFKLVDTLLKSIFSTNTVVFIGYSLGDYNIKLILNWVRNLQGEGFKNPYFIYVNENKLTDLDRIYYKSRGLEILDYKEFLEPQIDYLDRYKVILEKIIYFKENELLSSSGQIDYLYSLLKDINKLTVLRREDIYEKIKDEYIIDENGYIRKYKLNSDYIEEFNTLHNCLTSGTKIEEISVETKNKYEVIKEVFTKGQVYGYINGERLNYGFVSKLDNLETVYLDYKAMENYIKEDYNTLTQEFKKAYFLFKLGDFKKAFTLYSELAQKYFNNKDYLMYYFSQINRYNSYNAIQSLGTYAGSVVGILTGYAGEEEFLSEEDKLFMKDFSIDEIFDSLPLHFKKTYSSLRDLYNQKGLYKNIYKIKKATDKVRHNINSKSTELGFPSIGKVIGVLNTNLNFVYGNYLIVDEYEEFKELVKESLKSILLTYSDKTVKYITNDDLQKLRLRGKGIQLDSYDFSCLIQYFTTKELKDIFREYGIKQLEFIDFEKCFDTVENIFSYFESKKNKFNNRYLHQKVSQQVNNAVEILKYATLSIEQYGYVVNKIFKIDNRILNIGNKILFLDKQQAFNPNIRGNEICEILEITLGDYLNELIKAIDQKTNFNEDSVNSLYHIDIITYIVENDNEFKSETISKQIEKMIESQKYIDIEILIALTPILDPETLDKILSTVRDNMKHSFNFNIFKSLIANNLERECQNHEDKLIKYLKDIILTIQSLKSTIKDVNGGTDINRLSELSNKERKMNEILESIGYWSLIGILNKEKYNEFKNINDLFDFFMDIDSFNFDRFDESWLINISLSAHENISRNEKAKKYIKKKIESYLNDSSFDLQQKESLLKFYLNIYNG